MHARVHDRVQEHARKHRVRVELVLFIVELIAVVEIFIVVVASLGRAELVRWSGFSLLRSDRYLYIFNRELAVVVE